MITGLATCTSFSAWQRADVGAPVALDLRLVAHAAEAEAVKLAPQRVGN
jgi:hypothetical protein